jgi:hypothetical protein
MVFPDLLKEQEGCAFGIDGGMCGDEVHADNLNTNPRMHQGQV